MLKKTAKRLLPSFICKVTFYSFIQVQSPSFLRIADSYLVHYYDSHMYEQDIYFYLCFGQAML